MPDALLNAAWRSYAEKAMRPDTPLLTRIEARRAFYAGASTAMAAIISLLNQPDAPGDEAVALFNSLTGECTEFQNDVKAGHA